MRVLIVTLEVGMAVERDIFAVVKAAFFETFELPCERDLADDRIWASRRRIRSATPTSV
jgi:hypothetical protein